MADDQGHDRVRGAGRTGIRRLTRMTVHGNITREVYAGASGPEVGALFDLDRTLLAGFSALTLFRQHLLSGRMAPRELVDLLVAAANFTAGRTGFSGLMTSTAGALRGTQESALEKFGREVFESQLAGEIYPESRALVEAHKAMGHTVAIVSSATRYQAEPLARDMEIPHVLCSHLEVSDGVFTGEILTPLCYGQGKLLAARKLAADTGIDLAQSYFYSDSDEDLPILEAVAHPRPLNPNRKLAVQASRRGWPIRRFTSRGTPGLSDILRTALAVGSLGTSFLTGLPALALNGSRRQAVNVSTTLWGELGTALAGIDVRVQGEEHLWSERPAVFVFNHQSGIDVLLLCKLLKRDFVGIAKQELRANPLWGPIFEFAGTVFLDRFNHNKAMAAIEPAVDTLRAGLSIVIAPEGTRSSTPKLGKFKRGAFLIATQAGVPIVPIVFRNALDALPKHARIVRPAAIEAVVLPPVSTRGWTQRDLDRHVSDIHSRFEDVLRNHPRAD